jgi:GAF domain-containing protein
MTPRDADPPQFDSRQSVLLAQTFVTLADTLVDDYDVVDLMDRLVTTCTDLLDVTAAGILLVDQRGGLQVVASSSEEMRLVELFQLQNEEGPCLDSISSGQAVDVDNLSTSAGRWPRFSAEAARVGYRSVHAVPLRLREEVIGGLNLFRDAPPAFTDGERRIAQALADAATIGILQQRSVHRAALLAEQLQTALDSRIVIEQAKGVLAQHHGVGMNEAYRLLRRHARDHNLRMGVLAEALARGDQDPAQLVATAR